MDKFKESSQGFDAFEKIAARFQDIGPEEFRQQFMTSHEPPVVTKDMNPKVIKLWEEFQNLQEQGKYEDIIRCMDSIINLDSKSSQALHVKGSVLHHLDKHEESLKCFEKAIELDENDAGAWNNKGDALDHLGKKEESVRCFEKAIEL